MAEIWSIFQQVWAFASPHWPGLGWTLMAMLVGQVMAHRVFTREEAMVERSTKWFWVWMRRTLALHSVALGALLGGIFWVNPEGADPAWGRVGSAMYFAFFGGMSTWVYEMIKGLAHRQGIELELPGGDDVRVSVTVANTPSDTSKPTTTVSTTVISTPHKDTVIESKKTVEDLPKQAPTESDNGASDEEN